MGLLAILEAIRASGEAELSAIENKTQTKVREILATARMEARQIEEQACSDAIQPAFPERSRIIHRARLEGLQVIGRARHALVESAMERTRGHLAGIRDHSAYPCVLRRLIEEALDELKITLETHTCAHVEADPRDREAVEKILNDMGVSLPIEYKLDCWGGVVAKSPDQRLIVINTLESRLEAATPTLHRYLAAIFEAEKTDAVSTRWLETISAH